MNQIFQFVSSNLILVGIVFFLVSGEKTALIPAIMGIVIQFNILISNKFNKFHKHFAHLSLIILILGVLEHLLPFRTIYGTLWNMGICAVDIRDYTPSITCHTEIESGRNEIFTLQH